MNKITLDFFQAKSKTAIKGLLVLFALLIMNTQTSWGQVNITPTRTDFSGFPTWTDSNLAVASSTYLQLLTATSQTISPAMDFNSYTSETLNFKARTFGGVNAVENILTIWISTDNGSNWTSLGTRTPTSTTLTAQTAFDISPYNGTQVKIKFTVGGTSNTVGAGIDDISITGIVFSSGPEINIKGNSVSIVDGATPASTSNDTDFGTVATSTNVFKTYTIQNTGSADLTVSAIALTTGTNYTIGGISLPATIIAGTETTFTVTFNSASAGTFNDVVNITSNDTDETTYNFDITAVAQAPVPNISVKGNSIIIAVGDTTPSIPDNTDFGSTATNTIVVKTYTIENSGTGDLTVNDILMLNAPTSKYAIGGISLPATIAAGASTTFTLTFNSASAGTFADNVLIDNNVPTDSTYDFAVTAKAVALNFAVGDISITAMTTNAPDSFTIVNWVPIPVDAELIFTDNAYDELGALKTNEHSVVWKNNSGNIIPVGTVILINDTPSTDLGTIVSGKLNGLSSSNENIFIYEGSSVSPNFIYGLSNLAWITTGATTTNNSYLPTELNVTNGNIVTGAFDNVEYSGALAPKDEKSSFSAYKILVNDPANWIKNNTPFALNSIDFELAAVWETTVWTDGLTPTASLKTILNDTYSTSANGTFTAKKLTVTSLGSLTINSGTNVTVQNEVINSGALVIENNANLIQVNNATNTGSITVNRDSNSLFRSDYTLWSSPVRADIPTNQTLLAFSPLTAQTPTNRFYTYNPTSNLYSSIAASSKFSTGVGYLIRMPHTGSTDYNLGTEAAIHHGVFTGVPYNGDLTLTVSSGSYNAIGNPYPSTISADDFIDDNGIAEALYFWRKTNNPNQSTAPTTSYATYTFAGGVGTSSGSSSITPNGTIQVGQGFIAKSTSTSLVFTNLMRTGNNSNRFLKTKKIERNRIWLNLTNTSGAFSQMMIAYMDGATQGIDAGIDGRFFNDTKTALNSFLNNEEFVIQGRSLPFDGTDVVSLAFKAETAGDYSIAIDHTDGLFANGQDIYLVDNTTGLETNLKETAYTFNAAAGTDNSRFSLKFQKTLSVIESSFDENSVIVYQKNGAIYINSKTLAINSVKVYDIQGRLLNEQKNLKANAAVVSNLRAKNQILIVKVVGENNSVVSKKIMN